jgi:hypothetical protein
MDNPFIEFCMYIQCQALSLDQESRIIQYCCNCKIYQLFNFFYLDQEFPLGVHNNFEVMEKDSNQKAKQLRVYKRALQLACEDVKKYKRYCPRFYRMWDCSKSLCPDSTHEWMCWARAYLKISRSLEGTEGI